MADCGCNHFPASGGNVTFDPGVQVGIGTANPGAALAVNGQLVAGAGGGPLGIEPLDAQGPNAGVSLADRAGPASPRWVVYPNAGTFRLWNAASGDQLGLTSGGSLGTGTASPGAPLEVSTGSLAAPGFVATFNGNGEIGDDTGLGHPGDGLVTVLTNGSERLRVDGSGNIGVGAQGPAYPLDVNGVARVSGVLLVGQDVTLNGKLNRSIGGALVGQGGCYYAT